MGYQKLGLFILFLGQGFILFAQNRPEWLNWYFGYGAGISFNGTTPVAVKGKTGGSEGCAVASSPSGGLLFYTDGVTIWNKYHVPMKNGTGLMGHFSSTQSAIILSVDRNKYFVFTSDAVPGSKGYNYSEVDMSADNGLGEVVPGRKNMPIFKPCTERMTLARANDSLSYWLITRQPNSNIIKSFRVNSQGLDTVAVISYCVQTVSSTNGWGNMVVSNKGDKIAAVYPQNLNVVLYDFDRKSGKLSNATAINNIFSPSPNQNDYYSALFSPNSRYLYVSGYIANLKQVDTWEPAATMGINARKLVEKKLNILGTLQYSPDGKSIYLARNGYHFISSIPFPDLEAPACGFTDTAILLSAQCRLGLPAFVSGYLSWDPDFTPHNQCQGDSTFFELKPGSSIPDSMSWDFGDSQTITSYAPYSGPKHYYTQTGTYQVKMIAYHQGKALSVSYPVKIFQKPDAKIGHDTIICKHTFAPFTLFAPAGPGSFRWHNGSSNAFYLVKDPGVYWLEVNNGNCTDRDTVRVLQDSALFEVDLGKDSAYCEGEQVTLDAGYPGASYLWQDQQNQRIYTVTQSGEYSVQVKHPGFLCPAYDSIQVIFKPLPLLELGPEKAICPNEVLKIDLQNKGYDQVLWEDGRRDSLYPIKEAGLYKLKVWSAGCSSKDSLLVRQVMKRDLGLKKQYKNCAHEKVEIDLSAMSGTLSWADAGQEKKRSLSRQGWYWYVYSDSGCTTKDSFYVEHILLPQRVLPSDTTICSGESIWLRAAAADSYLWQDGTAEALYKVKEPGRYTVLMQNSCGTVTDSTNVWDCSCVIYVPSAFSPNEDGLNEEFKPMGCEPEYYRLHIYNRWGEKLFESNTFGMGWNGLYKGRLVTDDVLVWIIEYSSNTKSKTHNRMMKGTLSVLH